MKQSTQFLLEGKSPTLGYVLQLDTSLFHRFVVHFKMKTKNISVFHVKG